MTESIEAEAARESIFVRGWRKIPLVIRAVVLGLIVNTIGVGAWVLCSMTIPAPWSIAVMAMLLWLYWKYFSGSWWPESTQVARRTWFRSTRLSSVVWKWGLAAAALFVVVFESTLVVTFRVTEFPAELFKEEYLALGEAPLWMAWLFIVMSSLVAGVCEETGFRGYMQVPLEKRYGPVVAVSIVTVVFVAAHLHQAWLGPIMVQALFGSVLIAVLAYASGSLVPGMIAHTIMDIFNFSYWWTDVAGKFDRRPIAETGWDAHALIWILILVTALAAYLWIIRRLVAIRLQRRA